MDATAATATERPARECDCPDLGWGITKCVHYGAVTLRLLDALFMPDIATDPDEGVRFVVETGDYSLGGEIAELYAGDSESDALAAFYEAERQLLRGDADA